MRSPGMAVFALAMLVALPVLATGNDARDWILRMNVAVASRNFDGWLVLRIGERSERLRIIHRMQRGQMSERVITTDGTGREFVREGSDYTEYWPEHRVAVKETRNRAYGFLVALNGLNPESDRYYDISLGGVERLIGREAQQVRLEPKDGLRYGYRFWLDRQTSMPLKSQLVTKTGEVLEEISFQRLAMPPSIPDDLLKPDVDTSGPAFRWMRRDSPLHNPNVKVAFTAQPDGLPAGFRVATFESPADEALAKGPRTRFIVSDGIAWVSVFVDVADPERHAGNPADRGRADGLRVFGSLAAYESPRGTYKVTAVGEVPPATIRAIAEAFRSE